MTPIAVLLARIGWTPGELARRLECADGTTHQWKSGRRAPPPYVVEWLEEVAAALAKVRPTPVGWDGVRPGRRAV